MLFLTVYRSFNSSPVDYSLSSDPNIWCSVSAFYFCPFFSTTDLRNSVLRITSLRVIPLIIFLNSFLTCYLAQILKKRRSADLNLKHFAFMQASYKRLYY